MPLLRFSSLPSMTSCSELTRSARRSSPRSSRSRRELLEALRSRGLKGRGGRRETTAKVLKDRRSRTRTRSYGEPCDATPTCATNVFPTPTLPMSNTCRSTPASASATVFVRSRVDRWGTTMLEEGRDFPGGGRYCRELGLATTATSRASWRTHEVLVHRVRRRERASRRREQERVETSCETPAVQRTRRRTTRAQ